LFHGWPFNSNLGLCSREKSILQSFVPHNPAIYNSLLVCVYISAVNISNTAAHQWTQYWATTTYFLSSLRHFTKFHLNFFLPFPSLLSNWSDQERFLHLISAGFSKIRGKLPVHFNVLGSCILATLDHQYEQWAKSPSTCNIGPTNSLLPFCIPSDITKQYTRTHSMTVHYSGLIHNIYYKAT